MPSDIRLPILDASGLHVSLVAHQNIQLHAGTTNAALPHAPIALRAGTPQAAGAVASPNGLNWFAEDATTSDFNGSVPFRNWGVRNSVGDVFHAGCNVTKRMSRFDIFLLMFPPRMTRRSSR